MAEKRGVTIDIGANTSQFDSKIKSLNKEISKTTKELRQVDNALKFNPTSVELWRQKQELLSKKINETQNKLDQLKQKQATMDAQGVDKNSEQYRKLQREIIETESKLKHFKSELMKIGQVNLRAMSEQFKQMGASLEQAGRSMQEISAVAGAVAVSIGALAVKSGQWADDLNTMSKQYSIGTKELQMYSAAAELVDVDVDTIAKSHIKLERSMSSASKGTGAQAEAFKKLGIEVTDANGELREGDVVWQETIKALGQVENETERDALAMQLMGKSASELNPLIEDGGEAYENLAKTMEKYGLDFIDEETLEQANEFNDALDTIKAVGMVAFQQLGTILASYLAPAMEKIVGVVGRFAEWLTNLDPKVLAIIGSVAGILAVLAPLLIVLGKVATGISALMSLFAVLAGPVGIVIAVIAALVAVGVLLYKNWDTIKAKAIAFKNNLVTAFNDLKNKVTSTFNSIKNAIVNPIQTAINTVRNLINRIKSFFPISIGKVMSNLKLPHFKLSGKFDLKSLSVPKLSVSWYKTGGIFDSPSIIGVGEAGSEAVVPLNKLWEKLDNIASASGEGIVINVYGTPSMDVNDLAIAVERRLALLQKQREMVWI